MIGPGPGLGPARGAGPQQRVRAPGRTRRQGRAGQVPGRAAPPADRALAEVVGSGCADRRLLRFPAPGCFAAVD